MAFTDPLAVTLQGAALSLVRIDQARGAAEYSFTSNTQKVTAVIRSTTGKADKVTGRVRERHNISLRQEVFGTSTTPAWNRTASFTTEHYTGDDYTAWDDLAIALAGMLTAPNMLKLANFES